MFERVILLVALALSIWAIVPQVRGFFQKDEDESEHEHDHDHRCVCDEDSQCMDCDVDTRKINEYYMVHDGLWSKAVPDLYANEYGQLCIGCLEMRLGRLLAKDDFADVPVNVDSAHGPRLASRLTA